MTKADHTPLLPPGLHQLTREELFELAVQPWSTNPQRAQLYRGLLRWSSALRLTGLPPRRLWINGSFLTMKPKPRDIDCALWCEPDDRALDLLHLLDHAVTRLLYSLDVYAEMPEPAGVLHREAYWRGLFGFAHDGHTAKGFVELTI
ncbi:DUF6932 family protein [Zemynaea arenosa]|uniref:DUF6932 family protein n=1 Tax=Zemynaea arenosa TaxID=2561931 RepID=UPI003F903AC7